MHPLWFQIKRAHHRIVAFGKHVLRRFSLTPSRFDLLYVVYKRWMFQKRLYDAPAQTDLCRILGVTAATVSRMVRSLEELGIVRRFGNPVDRRTKQVTLTDEGLALFQAAFDHVFRKTIVDLACQRAFGEPSEPMVLAVIRAKRDAQTVAKGFGDTSLLSYDWVWNRQKQRG